MTLTIRVSNSLDCFKRNIDFAYCYIFRSVVCLSAVYHVRALHWCTLLKACAELDATWQIHLWGPIMHC